MTDWEPATEAETAMRDALQANDQELYFRILAQTELFLPVSAQALAGEAPMGWGTWTTGGRTHVLAFTSTAAVHACLGATAGPSRRRAFADLATDWPHHEWWLAVNPGLPVEGYLPAWFVSQLSRGDVRLPGRTMGARARLERAETLARARGDAAPGQEPSSAPPPGVPTTGGWTPPRPATPAGAPASGATAIGAVPEGRSDPSAVRIPGTPPASPGSARDADDAGAVDGGARGGNGRVPAAPGGPTDLLRPSPLRRRSLGEETGPANGRSSFFEPAPGRGGAVRSPRDNPLRAGDRAAPSPRPGLGGQPFPRRRPATNLPDDDPTRAFQVDDDPTRAFRVDDQATQPIPAPAPADRRPDPLAEEPTRAFRLDRSAAEATQALPRRTLAAADEQTQRLPDPTVRPVPPAAPASFAEELPASIAEPVSGPPAPRRGFSPIVIEGTVIESRDLPGPHEPDPVTAAFGWRPTVGAPRVDDEAADVSAPSSPAPGSRPGPVDAELASIAFPAGAAFPTAPATTGPVDAAPSSTTPSSAAPASTGRFGAAPASNGPVDSGPATTEPVESGPATTEPVRAPFAGPATVPPTAANGTPSDLDSAWLPSGGAPAAGVTPDDAGPEPTLRTTPSAGTAQAAPTAPTLAQAAPTAAQAAAPTAAQAAPTGSAGPDAVAAPATGPAVDAVAFQPANEVEEDLLDAAGSGSTDTFLSTLLLARVLLPVSPDSAPGSRPGEPGFVWRTEELDGEPYVVVHTSPERLADHAGEPVETVEVRFVQLIRRWPEENWSFAVNPGTPVGAKLPGEQIVNLASWAAEVGLGDDPEVEPAAPAEEPAERSRYAPTATDPSRPVVMQKAVAPSQLAYYLERGYDRVSGFVHRAGELAHLTTPAQLHGALGLGYPDSPFARDAEQIYLLRWPAYRPSLYRIPYGGQNEAAMRAMEGWVIERAPFRGNGFAPGESSDVVAEFKVDSARLPHGAQLWRVGADGTERVIAIFDADALLWRQVGES